MLYLIIQTFKMTPSSSLSPTLSSAEGVREGKGEGKMIQEVHLPLSCYCYCDFTATVAVTVTVTVTVYLSYPSCEEDSALFPFYFLSLSNLLPFLPPLPLFRLSMRHPCPYAQTSYVPLSSTHSKGSTTRTLGQDLWNSWRPGRHTEGILGYCCHTEKYGNILLLLQ